MFYQRKRGRGAALALALGLSIGAEATFGLSPVMAQDAAWDGLITSGRAALQQDEFAEAERLFEQALETAEKFPPGDPRLGRSLNNLAAVYYKQKDYDRAEPLMRRSLNVLEEALGPKTADVAQTKKNLAAIYYLQGNFADAEPLLQQSLATFEDLHGPSHAFVATVLNNLAALYQSQRRFAEAEPLLARSLNIWESLLGKDHRDVVRSRELLAELRRANGFASSEQPTAEAPEEPAPPLDASSTEQILALASEAEAAVASDRTEELAEEGDAALVPALALSSASASPNPDVPDEASDETELATRALADLSAQASAAAGWADDDRALAASDGAGQGGQGQDVLPTPEVRTAALVQPDATGPTSTSDALFSVYLSTLWSKEEAVRYWVALKRELPDILADKEMELEEITEANGGGSFYRVLTSPYPSDPDAQAACNEIKAQLRTHDCSVVAR